jgi:hypothetical protein
VYSIERVFYFIGDHKATQGCNDYVCLVIRVGVEELAQYLGGRYLVQIWKNKERLFQFVHSSAVSSHYCSARELCYTVEHDQNSQTFVYLVKPYKQEFARVLLPFAHIDQVKLFVNSEFLLMSQGRTLKCVRMRDLVNPHTVSYYCEGESMKQTEASPSLKGGLGDQLRRK